MLLIRRFEEAVLRLSNENQFIGHYHLYIGQEATGSAVISLLEPRDRLATTHRNHGHVLARGADPGRAMAEILGRASGLYGGRGGTTPGVSWVTPKKLLCWTMVASSSP